MIGCQVKKTMPEEWYDKGLRYVDESFGTPKKRNYMTTHHDAKMVVCEGIIFESVKLCADKYDINQDTMRSWLRGKRTMRKDFIEKGLRYANIDEINEFYKIE